MDGRIEFNRDFTDVVRVSSGGLFRLEAVEAGVRRELRIEPNGNGVSREYRLNGRVHPVDAQAQAWFAEFLITLDRRTALGVDIRLPRLLEQGGVAAVLAETRLSGDFARDRYLAKLVEARRLTPAETVQVLDQVATETRSDHYGSAALSRTASAHLDDPRVREATLRVVEGIQSDHYKHDALSRLLRGAPAGPERAALLEAARHLRSDHYGSAFVRAVAELPGTTRDDLPGLLRVMEALTSGHYAEQAIDAVSRLRDLNEADLLLLVTRAGLVRGDHYRGESLRHIVGHRAASAAVREAVRAAASTLSRHYREQVERAAGR